MSAILMSLVASCAEASLVRACRACDEVLSGVSRRMSRAARVRMVNVLPCANCRPLVADRGGGSPLSTKANSVSTDDSVFSDFGRVDSLTSPANFDLAPILPPECLLEVLHRPGRQFRYDGQCAGLPLIVAVRHRLSRLAHYEKGHGPIAKNAMVEGAVGEFGSECGDLML